MNELDLDLKAQDLADQVDELRGLAGADFSHTDVADAVWNDRYGELSDPAILGFRDNPDGNDKGLARKLWASLKAELRLLACTTSPKYSELRSKVAALKGQPGTVIVGVISATVAGTLGTAVAVVTPFVVIFLHGLVTVGVNTMCRTWK